MIPILLALINSIGNTETPGIPTSAVRYYDDDVESNEGVKYYDDGVESSEYVEYVDV